VPPGLDPVVCQDLLDREYQGNVRELRQVVYRLHTRHGATLQNIGRATQEAAIQIVLAEEGGSVKVASQRLVVSGRALQMRHSAAQITSGR
jgi:transcriptional regulator with PAS, ATPase and Fis domain